jgi:hypothetical protein
MVSPSTAHTRTSDYVDLKDVARYASAALHESRRTVAAVRRSSLRGLAQVNGGECRNVKSSR